jgi:hypothetical protein
MYSRGKKEIRLKEMERRYLSKKEKVSLEGTKDVYFDRFDRAALDSAAQFLTVRYNRAIQLLDTLNALNRSK